MNVTIGVPWRGGDPWRDQTWRYVREHLETGTDFPVTTADAGGEMFSRAGSRNEIMRDVAADVVILHDADMLAPAHAYKAMATLAHESGRLVIGYTQYRALDQDTTNAVIDRGADPFRARPCGATEGWSRGGIVAISPKLWRHVGGMDERFRGWGCEDWAFAHAAELVLGENLRVRTPSVHLWHQHGAGADPVLEQANGELMHAYCSATTVEQLRAVQERT